MSAPSGNGVFGPVAGQPDPSAPLDSTFSRQDFAQAVLLRGGWPVTQSNITFLLNWMQREGGNAAFNPINTTHTMQGASNYNSIGVKNYTSFEQGVAATIATLGGSFYGNIRAGLAAGQAADWDKAGRFASDLHAWSAGPNAPMSKGYTTVSNVDGTGLGGNRVADDPGSLAQSGMSLNDVMLTYAPELAQAMNDPEISNLVQRLDDGLNGGPNGISLQQFEAQLEQTNWWKNTPQSERDRLTTLATDPATAQQNLDNQTSSINRLAAQMGVGLPTGQAQKIALDSINGNWSSQQIQEQLASYAKYQGDITYKGEAATDVNTLRGIYKSMALPVDDQTLNQQLQNILGGKLTAQQIQDQAATQAATFYASNPQLSEFLKSGQGTAQQWAAPLISHIANIMGTDPNGIDLTNPQWTFILKPQTNPTTGQSTGMAQTLDSVEQQIKTDPVFQYSKTANGIKDYQGLIDKLQSTFTGGGV